MNTPFGDILFELEFEFAQDWSFFEYLMDIHGENRGSEIM